jgi:hypothetical protein
LSFRASHQSESELQTPLNLDSSTFDFALIAVRHDSVKP